MYGLLGILWFPDYYFRAQVSLGRVYGLLGILWVPDYYFRAQVSSR